MLLSGEREHWGGSRAVSDASACPPVSTQETSTALYIVAGLFSNTNQGSLGEAGRGDAAAWGNPEGSGFFLESGGGEWEVRKYLPEWPGSGLVPPKAEAVGLRGRGVQNEAQSSVLTRHPSSKKNTCQSPCSCRRPGHRLLFLVSLSETFLCAERRRDPRAKETRAWSWSCCGGRDP